MLKANKHRLKIISSLAKTFTIGSLARLMTSLLSNRFQYRYLSNNKQHLINLIFKEAQGRISIRSSGSDFQVLKQIFAEEDYKCVSNLSNIETVVDFGANIGLSSIYFARQLSPDRIIAVEPDPLNANLCRANLQMNKHNIELVESAVWPERVGLVVKRNAYRDGSDWSCIVKPTLEGEIPDILAIDPETLFNSFNLDRISLLKIDIEGSERALFEAESSRYWIRRVDNLVIELHDIECELAFRKAMQGFSYQESSSGDVIACLNIKELNA